MQLSNIQIRKKLPNALVPIIVAFCSTFYLESQAEAQTEIKGVNLALAELQKTSAIQVKVSDKVSGGCWTNTNRSKSMIERELLNAGNTNLQDTGTVDLRIYLEGTGYKTGNLCLVHMAMDIWVGDFNKRFFADSQFEVKFAKSAIKYWNILSGPQNDMSERIFKMLGGFVYTFVVDIQKEKNNYRDKILGSDASDLAKAAALNAILE